MDPVYVHLLINHVPLVGTAFCLTLWLCGAMKRSPDLKRAAAWGLVLMGLVTVPVYLSGREAEEKVERIKGVAEDAIEEHEADAQPALYTAGASALVAAVYLWATRRGMKAPAGLPVFVFIAGSASLALLGLAARHGGHIRHTELAGAHHHGGHPHQGTETAVDHEE